MVQTELKVTKVTDGVKGDDGTSVLDELIEGGILPKGSGPNELAQVLKGEKGTKGEKGSKGCW